MTLEVFSWKTTSQIGQSGLFKKHFFWVTRNLIFKIYFPFDKRKHLLNLINIVGCKDFLMKVFIVYPPVNTNKIIFHLVFLVVYGKKYRGDIEAMVGHGIKSILIKLLFVCLLVCPSVCHLFPYKVKSLYMHHSNKRLIFCP